MNYFKPHYTIEKAKNLKIKQRKQKLFTEFQLTNGIYFGCSAISNSWLHLSKCISNGMQPIQTTSWSYVCRVFHFVAFSFDFHTIIMPNILNTTNSNQCKWHSNGRWGLIDLSFSISFWCWVFVFLSHSVDQLWKIRILCIEMYLPTDADT